MSTPSAAWPVDALVGALCRSGWGLDLDGRRGQGMRSTLRGLVDLLPHGSAQGDVTIGQIADAAGLSTKWAAKCMVRLVKLGLIKWTRGHVERGCPLPGSVLIVKRALALLVQHLRRTGRLDDRRRARAQARDDRLAKYPGATLWPRKPRNPLSVHAELSSTLPFRREEPGPTAGLDSPHKSTEAPMIVCIHGNPYPHRCALCRRRMAQDVTLDPATLVTRTPDLPPVPMPPSIKQRLASILHPHHQDKLL